MQQSSPIPTQPSAQPSEQTRPATGATPPTLEQIKARMKATWESGDYAHFARYMEPGARQILADWGITAGSIHADERLLDVGCGAGQTAIPAARTGARVYAIDIAANLVAAAQARAARENVRAEFQVGDAECIPYPAASFDRVISLIGAMFAPRPEQVVDEFARVCKPGARLAMANWTPASLPGRMFKLAGQWVAPPPGVPSPVLWGDEATVRERLSADFTDIRLTRKHYPAWKYPFSVTELVDFFRSCFGPVQRVFQALDESDQQRFHQELTVIFAAHSKPTGDGIELLGEYLDVQAVRR